MKKYTVLVILMLLLSASFLAAQTVKIGYIDTDRIMQESKATQEAQTLFRSEQAEWEKELSVIEEEIQRLQSEFDARQLTLTESGKTQAKERIDAKISERRQFIERIFGETGVAMQRNAELLEPIMNKLRDSIEKIAIEENYSIVFDAVGGGILYARPNLDITDIVLQDMNEE
jgi:outer membrane protein